LQPPPPELVDDGGDDRKGSLFPRKTLKPVAFDKFSEHVAMMAKNSCLEYNGEFEVGYARLFFFLHDVAYL